MKYDIGGIYMAYNDDLQSGNPYEFQVENVGGGYHADQYGSPHDNPSPQKRNRSKLGVRIIALCLSCTLLGGLAGGAAVKLLGLDSNTQQVVLTAAPVAKKTSSENSSILPASQIYSNNVISCVSIQATVTGNYYGRALSSTVTGSGFIISANGYIVTNHHVIASVDSGSVSVMLSNGQSFDAVVVGSEEANDIAVLKINAEGLTPVKLGSSSSISVGDPIYAIGDPLGTLNYTMTAGIVSGLDRIISTENSQDINTFQIDAAVNSGNSGGPVFNAYGEVVGIVTAKYSDTGVEGLGFAIPVDEVITMINDLVAYGKVKNKPFMGIQVMTATEKENGVAGASVYSVTADSPASKAGLKAGDVITEMGGQAIGSQQELVAAKNKYKAGETVKLKIYRDGGNLELSLTFGEAVS